MPRPVHFEITADDPTRALSFYEKVFGWKFSKWEGPFDYWMATTGEGPGIDGAIMPRMPEMPGVINTIDVADCDTAIAAIVAAGGHVVQPKATVPGVGYFAYVTDTEGNVFGVMQDDPSATM